MQKKKFPADLEHTIIYGNIASQLEAEIGDIQVEEIEGNGLISNRMSRSNIGHPK